jgi:hypothetical protein
VCVKQQNWVCVSMTMRRTIGYPRSCLPRSRLVSGSLPFALAAHGSRAPRSTICVPSRLPVSPTRRSIRCPAKVWRVHHSVRPTRWSKRCPQTAPKSGLPSSLACHGFTNASNRPSVRPSLAPISSNFRQAARQLRTSIITSTTTSWKTRRTLRGEARLVVGRKAQLTLDKMTIGS